MKTKTRNKRRTQAEITESVGQRQK